MPSNWRGAEQASGTYSKYINYTLNVVPSAVELSGGGTQKTLWGALSTIPLANYRCCKGPFPITLCFHAFYFEHNLLVDISYIP